MRTHERGWSTTLATIAALVWVLSLSSGVYAGTVQDMNLGDTLTVNIAEPGVGTVKARFPVVAGTLVSINVKVAKGSSFAPLVLLRDEEGTLIPLGGTLTLKSSSARVRNFPIASTGTYEFEIAGSPMLGDFTAKTSGKFPGKISFSGTFPEDDAVAFDVLPGSELKKGQVKATKGSAYQPAIASVEDDGGALDVQGLKAKGKKAGFKSATASTGGTVVLTLGGSGTGDYTGKVSVKAPKSKQKLTLDATPDPLVPVDVSASITGDAVPGAALMANAAIDIGDGSTIESIEWTQPTGLEATIGGAETATATVTLASLTAYKDHLFELLAEPPISPEDLPPNVELPEGEFPAALPSRFQVVGLNPFVLEETALATLKVTVTTTSGTYSDEVDIHAALPWKVAPGIRNVPRGVPVLLHGRDHVDENGDGLNDQTGADVTTYDWALQPPAGSGVTLVEGTSQNPYFIPDVDGSYTITVTDNTQLPGDEVVTLELEAGTWQGAITGQDEDGRPLAADCTGCHNGVIAPDKFTEWARTGHAEIFTDNLNTSTHYGSSCFPCHTVGYDPEVENGGVDDAPNYEAFLEAGLLNNPGDNWTTMLADFPDVARLANIQCENCHGPQASAAHTQEELRLSLASDVCATCHGEPLRHARFQQWQLSPHANYELAIDEGDDGNCSRCHTVNGFLTWLPILLDDDPATDPTEDITVAWTIDEVHPQTCVACHDPHDAGTTSGIGTNATVRISGNTPPLVAGFTAVGVGRGAICMTCHNSRRGLRNDDTFAGFVGTSEAARAPHGSAQTDVLMGQNAYLVNVGIRGSHSFVEDTCVNCHMEQTPPPDLLSYNFGGSNHTFTASDEICSNCHGDAFNAKGVQSAFEATLDELQILVEEMMLLLISDQIDAGFVVDLDGEATITNMADVASLTFGERSGRQAITVNFTDETSIGPVRLPDVTVLASAGGPCRDGLERCELYDFADPALIKSGWNWNLVHNDGSQGIHNPSFALEVLDASIDALVRMAAP